MIVDFIAILMMSNFVFQEVFNGVWDALPTGVELAIGATRAIPVGGRYAASGIWGC